MAIANAPTAELDDLLAAFGEVPEEPVTEEPAIEEQEQLTLAMAEEPEPPKKAKGKPKAPSIGSAMELTVDTALLGKALALAGKAISNGDALLPTMLCYQLVAKEGQLQIAAVQSSIGIRVTIPASVYVEGGVMITAETLAGLVGTLKGKQIRMNLNGKNQKLNLECGPTETSLNGLDIADAPLGAFFQELEAGDTAAMLDAGNLRDARRVTFASSKDGSRPTLACVEVTIRNGEMFVASTDGHRAAWRTVNAKSAANQPPVTVLVPYANIDKLADIAKDMGTEEAIQVAIHEAGNILTARLEGEAGGVERVDFTSGIIAGAFPAYRAILPTETMHGAVVKTTDLTSIAKTALLFAQHEANKAMIRFVPPSVPGLKGCITISAATQESGKTESSVDAEITGPALEMWLNIKYLIEAVDALDEDQVELRAATALRPLVIKSPNQPANERVTVMMPMHATQSPAAPQVQPS